MKARVFALLLVSCGGESVAAKGGAGGDPECGTGGFVMPNPVSTGLPNPASYDTSATGVVTDLITGLMWERDRTALASGVTPGDALSYCSALDTAGYSDWHLPTLIELVSIVDSSRNPKIDATAFPGTRSTCFWTSSADASAPGSTWSVDFGFFGDGLTFSYDDRSSYCSPRCVRRPELTETCPAPRFTSSAGWVLDSGTELTWQETFISEKSLDDAKAICAELGSEARLPSFNELQTILDDSRSNPAIDPTAFPGIPSDSLPVVFWTSSLNYTVSGSVPATINFNHGDAVTLLSTDTAAVRCVR